ncbi:MAG: YciI family protein, partial [Alphaproteobacteria bacterium]|nr:YciI family protein [Alphaproteobacteria bacterium]
MLFVIYAKDQAEDTNALRNEHYAAHKEHLEKCGDYGVEIVTAGPLVSDDARRALGSLIICQAEARQDVITF